MKLGTVSMRVALVLRSAEVQPLFQDLCIGLLSSMMMTILSPLPTSSKAFPKERQAVPPFCRTPKRSLTERWDQFFDNNQQCLALVVSDLKNSKNKFNGTRGSIL